MLLSMVIGSFHLIGMRAPCVILNSFAAKQADFCSGMMVWVEMEERRLNKGRARAIQGVI